MYLARTLVILFLSGASLFLVAKNTVYADNLIEIYIDSPQTSATVSNIANVSWYLNQPSRVAALRLSYSTDRINWKHITELPAIATGYRWDTSDIQSGQYYLQLDLVIDNQLAARAISGLFSVYHEENAAATPINLADFLPLLLLCALLLLFAVPWVLLAIIRKQSKRQPQIIKAKTAIPNQEFYPKLTNTATSAPSPEVEQRQTVPVQTSFPQFGRYGYAQKTG